MKLRSQLEASRSATELYGQVANLAKSAKNQMQAESLQSIKHSISDQGAKEYGVPEFHAHVTANTAKPEDTLPSTLPVDLGMSLKFMGQFTGTTHKINDSDLDDSDLDDLEHIRQQVSLGLDDAQRQSESLERQDIQGHMKLGESVSNSEASCDPNQNPDAASTSLSSMPWEMPKLQAQSPIPI